MYRPTHSDLSKIFSVAGLATVGLAFLVEKGIDCAKDTTVEISKWRACSLALPRMLSSAAQPLISEIRACFLDMFRLDFLVL